MIALSLALLKTVHRSPDPDERRSARVVTWSVVVGVIVVVLINEFRS
ncbi:MAG: hypothetical protein OEM81_12960 [Acidimicrobiia bacterium]|nr:hypothetical protein [Acidimicrobiia bacterium]